ncbi:MAG: hypothetical protein HJJLKODD_02722 [Phycisphaerae bacterium]|nr:hypothetical protein [Phycisphaerae bacterium]
MVQNGLIRGEGLATMILPGPEAGSSHAWNVPAISAEFGSTGPVIGSAMYTRLDEGQIKCGTCHDAHNHSAGDPYLRGAPNALCQECHAGHPGHTVSGSWQPTCTDCHQAHDPFSGNRSLVRTTVLNQTLSQIFPVTLVALSGPGSFSDGDPAVNDGICQVCHIATSYHRYDGSGAVHNPGSNCIACHPHESGFLPTGGDCLSCHTVAQDNGDGIPAGGRRAVVGEFAYNSHHVQGAVDGSHCTIYHDQSAHQAGQVLLRDVDHAGVSFNYDQLTLVEIEPFCLHCHDADGDQTGAGTQPFGDGIQIPNIERTGGWAAAAHKTGGISGSGFTCLDCHAQRHGSNLKNLLSPWDGEPGVDQVNEEEGFCYSCHSPGGVINEALSNGWFGGAYSNFADSIAAAFDQTHIHPVNDSSAGHQFMLGLQSLELECESCHDPHQPTGKYWAAISNQTPITMVGTGQLWGDQPAEKIGAYDPAHTYAAPFIGAAGVDLSGDPLPVDGSGYSQMTATVLPDYNSLCLSCHQYAMDHVAAINWSVSKHGSAAAEPLGPAGWPLAAPYESTQRGQYYLACIDCHEAHGSANAWMFKRSINGAALTEIITGESADEWRPACNQCHSGSSQNRHHNADVYIKLGMPPSSPNCLVCHEIHMGGIYTNCVTSGCHNHDDFF